MALLVLQAAGQVGEYGGVVLNYRVLATYLETPIISFIERYVKATCTVRCASEACLTVLRPLLEESGVCATAQGREEGRVTPGRHEDRRHHLGGAIREGQSERGEPAECAVALDAQREHEHVRGLEQYRAANYNGGAQRRRRCENCEPQRPSPPP